MVNIITKITKNNNNNFLFASLYKISSDLNPVWLEVPLNKSLEVFGLKARIPVEKRHLYTKNVNREVKIIGDPPHVYRMMGKK